MKNKKIPIAIYRMLSFVLCVMISSCTIQNNKAEMAGEDEYYTCSMDPQVIENKSGNCPICHMELIKVKKNNLLPGQIKLSSQQIKLANITYDTLRVQGISKEVYLTGKVTIDQNKTVSISARVQGRIEKLLVKNIGDYIQEGQVLYEMYSEDLNIAQQEFLHASQSGTSVKLIDASRNKLRLYGMNDKQIELLITTNQILQFLPVFSQLEGFISDISVTEGSYISEGTTLFRLATYSSLWVEAEVYLPYLSYLSIGTKANFNIPSASDNLFSGEVVFIDPQVQSPNRVVLARFHINNQSPLVKPGMLVNISLQTVHKNALVLPIDAIIQDSKGVNVWVRNSNGIFDNKMVTVGMQNNRQIEIKEGLEAGDVVVVTGAYLLNSEYVFKKGANPMEGHSAMPEMKM